MTLSWGLLICTYNRAEVLAEAVGLALRQSRPPAEIIIVDASPDWTASRDRIAAMTSAAAIPLQYEPASERSSATQRNRAVALAEADILFLIDDDSFLFPQSAEAIMAVYDTDVGQELAGVGLTASPDNPSAASPGTPRKQTGHGLAASVTQQSWLKRPVRWFYSKVLMMQHEQTFIAYASHDFPKPAVPKAMADFDLHGVNHISGYAMTVRRGVALAEPFDTALRYYAALEDADASHRFLRHGALVVARRAKVHHFQTGASRLPRDKVIILQLLNLAIFLKRHSPMLAVKERQYGMMLWRRLLAELLKDLLSRRFTLPQLRGVRYVMGIYRDIFAMPLEALLDWYPDFQRRLIEDDDYAAWPSSSAGAVPLNTRS